MMVDLKEICVLWINSKSLDSVNTNTTVCLVQIPIALSPSTASLPEKSASEPRRLSRVGCRCAGTFLRVHRSTVVAAFRSRSTGSAVEDTELFAPVSLWCPRSEDDACVRFR